MMESQFHSGQIVSYHRILETLGGAGRGCLWSNGCV